MKIKTPLGDSVEISDDKVSLSFRYAQSVQAALSATARVVMIEHDAWDPDHVDDVNAQAMLAACMLTLQYLARAREMTPSELIASVASSIGGERAMLLLLMAERELVRISDATRVAAEKAAKKAETKGGAS